MLKVLELFGGIGACSKALERLGIEFEIADYVEIDKYAVKSFNAMHDTNFEPQDICEWNKDIEVDLIMHGSPCQDFSVAGRQAGGNEGSGTRSSLMYETIRIVEKLRPQYVIWENVKNVLSKAHKHNFDNYISRLEELGYKSKYQVLNAKDYGVPQNRERVFVISILGGGCFDFPPKQELKIKLKDILESNVDEKYYLNNEQTKKIKFSSFIQEKKRIQEKDICDTLLARDWKGGKCVNVSDTEYPCTTRQKQIASTIMATVYKQGANAIAKNIESGMGYEGVIEKKCIQVGELDIKGLDCIKRVYSPQGCSPTLTNMQGGNRQPKIAIQKIDIPQIVKVRKYPVDTEKLKKVLKEHKNYSNKELAIILDKPVTLVEHWFRNDDCFSIPDADIWYKLKTLLKIQTCEFDKQITEFEEREGVFEKSNRCYFDTGLSPTITSASANEKIIVGENQ